MTSLGLEFIFARDADTAQLVYPEVELDVDGRPTGPGDADAPAFGPDTFAGGLQEAPRWRIDGNIGDKFGITFFRNPESLEECEVSWEHLGSGPVKEPAPRYFLIGAQNRWGKDGHIEMLAVGTTSTYSCKLVLQEK